MALFLVLSAPSVFADIKVGIIFFDPPLVVSPNQGFNVDLMKQICTGMKQNCQMVPKQWYELFPALNNREVDIIMGAFISPERAKNYIFSLPYMLSKGQFITLKDSGLTSLEQLKGKKVGLIKEETNSGIFHDYVQANFYNQFQVLDYDDVEDLMTALNNKTIDAAMMFNITAGYWIQNSDNTFVTLGSSFTIGEGEAIMALPDNIQLINMINQQIKQMENDGVYLNLYQRYFP